MEPTYWRCAVDGQTSLADEELKPGKSFDSIMSVIIDEIDFMKPKVMAVGILLMMRNYYGD
jgi:hypothetical protein